MRSRAGARGLAKRLGNDADDGLFLLHLYPNPTLKNFSFLAAVRIRRKEADVAHTCKKKVTPTAAENCSNYIYSVFKHSMENSLKNNLNHCV